MPLPTSKSDQKKLANRFFTTEFKAVLFNNFHMLLEFIKEEIDSLGTIIHLFNIPQKALPDTHHLLLDQSFPIYDSLKDFIMLDLKYTFF
jgi:hypothetical protein